MNLCPERYRIYFRYRPPFPICL